jgi:hypothetical protein
MSIPTIAFFKSRARSRGAWSGCPLEQLERQFGLTEFVAVKAD